MKQLDLTATLGRFIKKQPNFDEQIRLRKNLIENLKVTFIVKELQLKHSQKVLQADLELRQLDGARPVSHVVHSIQEKTQVNECLIQQAILQIKRSQGVSDTDKMIYEKKFKNFLNHREEFQRKAKERRQRILKARRAKQQGDEISQGQQQIEKEELLQETGGENQFQNASDMLAAYEQITTGKKAKKDGHLYHAQKIQYLFRREQFDCLIILEIGENERNRQNQLPTLITTISKDTLLNYLFDQPAIMMLYSINPFLLGDELAQFQTQQVGKLTFEQFSNFLLLDRQPTYFQYTRENLQEARKLGRGIKCQPIIAKWIGDEDVYEWLIQLYKEVDMMGNKKVEKQTLARKIRKQAQRKRILNSEVIEIVNINKFLTLDRLLYEIQFSTYENQKITLQQFQNYLRNYKRLQTPQKDKLTTKLILSGKYDPSYIFILRSEALNIIKQAFNSQQKFAQYFVPKQKFVQKLVKHPKFDKIRNSEVRSETNRYVKKETVEQTLVRFMNQAQKYVDIEEVLDFFTNRGRPRRVQHQIYLANLEIQLQRIQQEQRKRQEKKLSEGDYSTSSDEEQFQKSIRLKKTQRRKQKLASIRKGQNYKEGKSFSITIPLPFSFGMGTKEGKKTSIRQRKLVQMLKQKRKAEDESMIPFKPKQVPAHVKQDLYEKIMRDQQRQRKERLQRFRLQSKQKMYPVSQHLVKKKSISIDQRQTKASYKFLAKPLPWYCEVNLLQRINKQKQERRQRILQEIINKHQQYDLPEGVKKMLQNQQKTQQNKQKLRSMSITTADPQCTFNPRITQNIPDFKVIHQHLKIDLENKKQQKKPIQVQPFSFQNRPTRSRTALQPQKKSSQIKKHKVSKQDYQQGPQQINIPITMKYEALVNLRRQQERQKERKILEQKRAQTVRRMRQQKFAPYVRSVLRKSEHDPAKSRAIIEEKIKEFKRQERRKKAQYEEEMIKIYTKVFNRPLLIQTAGVQGHTQAQRHEQNQMNDVPYQNGDNYQNYAQDYEMNYQPQDQYSKRHDPSYQEMRRKAIEHPPRNYLMEDPNNNQLYQQEYQEDQYDEQYLSENGRYTN